MAKTTRDATQVDIEEAETGTASNKTDRAIRAVRAFQTGTGRTSDVKAALAELSPNQMFVVSIGTRVSIKSLEALRE